MIANKFFYKTLLSFPPSPSPSEASDGAVTKANSCGDPERQEHGCCFVSQNVNCLNKKNWIMERSNHTHFNYIILHVND